MEEESQVEVQVKLVDNTGIDVDSTPVTVEGGEEETLTNGDLHQKTNEGNKEEEEASLDGEFIKVEKESLDSKDSSHTGEAAAEENNPSAIERSSSNSMESKEFLEAQEKMKLELEKAVRELEHSQSEKAHLQEEIIVAKKKLEEGDKHCEELEVAQKRLQEQIREAEEKYSSQVNALQEALGAQEAKHKDLIDVKEAFDGLTVELEISRKKMQDLEQELKTSAAEAQKFEDLSKQSGSHAESESQKALEFEKLLELAKLSAKEMEDQMASLQVELKGQYHKIAENQQVEETLRSTVEELSSVRAELELSKSQVMDLEQKLNSGEAVINEFKNNALLMEKLFNELETKLKLSDDNFRKSDELLSEALSQNAELEQKLKSLEELHEESRVVGTTATQRTLELEDIIQSSTAAEEEAKSQLREIEILLISAEQRGTELEQQLNMAELKSSVVDKELQEFSEKTAELTDMLRGFEEESVLLKSQLQEYKDKATLLESSLSWSSQRNFELEQELKDVAEKCAEHENRASTTHQRSLELEDLIQLSHSKTEDAGKKVGELELMLEAANYRIQELEEQGRLLETTQAKLSSLEIELQAANEKERELMERLNVIMEERNKFEDASKSSSEKYSEMESFLEVFQNDLKSAKDKLEISNHDLQASSIRESEVMEKLKYTEEKLEQHGRVMEQATARSSELELLHESLSKDSELKLQEAMLSITQRDSEANHLSEKLKSLEDQAKIYQDEAMEASGREASLKGKLEESSAKLVTLENTIDELKRKVLEAESISEQSFSETELLSETNSKLKQELETHQIKVNELQELLSSSLAEKEATVEQLDSHVKMITELTEKHSKASEFQFATESRIREAEVQLHEAIERFTHKDSEAKDLNEKLNTLESQVRVYEEHANEASGVAESRKVELEEALLKIKHLEGIVEEMQSKASQFETESEGLAEANLKLTQELAAYETKMNEIQMMLNTILVEKEETVEQFHSSKKAIEDLTQQLASEGQRLQFQISSVMEENNLLTKTYQDSREELKALIDQLEGQLEGQLNEQKARENTLNSEVENLKAEIAEKSIMQTRIAELEQHLTLAESRLKEEAESIRAMAAEKEAGITSKLEDHVRTRGILDEQVLKLQEELNLAHTTIAEQGIEEERKLALVNVELDDLKNKLSQTVEVEKKMAELENKLKSVNTKSEEQGKEGIKAELKKGLEVTSRELGSSVSTPPKRKSKKKTETTPTQAPESSTTPTQTMGSSSSGMNFQVILGIALVSVIIGIVLGKRY
ncbi:early endosome antigen isoform X2 [Tasmannia lanceolata]|uniref:early endosome antigen isoform X2 n=1 Tax=Tasmannia lanceolata TaxID=3420 RepID=UPI004063F3F4